MKNVKKTVATATALPLAALVAFGITACGPKDDTTVSTTTVVTTTQTAEQGVPANPNAVVKTTNEGAVSALKVAQEAHQGGKVISIDREDKYSRWEVKVLENGSVTKVYVDYTGKIVGQEKGDSLDSAELAAFNGPTAALSDLIVPNSPKDAVLDEAELDIENGALVWKLDYDSVEGKDVAEIVVDGFSGAVKSKKQQF